MMGYDGYGPRPIYPVQQSPESNKSNLPFMTYTTRTTTFNDFWWRHVEDVAYTIWSTSIDTANETAAELIDLMRRMDDSAEELNDFTHSQGYDDFRFYYIRLISATSPSPTDSEGGRYGQPVTFRYEYSKTHGRGLT